MPTILELILSSSLAVSPTLGYPALIITQPLANNPDASELVMLVGFETIEECDAVYTLMDREYYLLGEEPGETDFTLDDILSKPTHIPDLPEYHFWCTPSLMEND